MRVFSFEDSCSVRDPGYKLPAGKTYALQLRKKFESAWRVGRPAASAPASPEAEAAESVDVKMITEQTAIKKLAEDKKLMGKLASEEGVAWGKLKADLKELLPDFLDDRDDWAYSLVVKFMNHIAQGEQDQAWESYPKPKEGTKKGITYVCLKKNNGEAQ